MFRNTVALSLAFVACGGKDAPTTVLPIDTGTTNTAPSDSVPPTVQSFSPADGTSGVAADVDVVITFSEAMDPGSVEASLDSSALGAVALSWNEGQDVLTISPYAPLAYAPGVLGDISVPYQYAVIVGDGAADLAGNPMGTTAETEFATYRSLSTVLYAHAKLTRSLTPEYLVYEGDDPLVVGDDEGDNGVRSVLSFDLAGVPPDAVGVTSATIATRQLVGDAEGTPYVDLGASVQLDHVSFAALDSVADINYAFNTSQQAFSSADGFCTAADQVVVEFDVTEQVDEDVRNLDSRQYSQFLLRFDGITDVDAESDRAVFDRDTLELQVDVIVP